MDRLKARQLDVRGGRGMSKYRKNLYKNSGHVFREEADTIADLIYAVGLLADHSLINDPLVFGSPENAAKVGEAVRTFTQSISRQIRLGFGSGDADE